MEKARELEALLAELQACLARADKLKLEFVAIFLCQAIDQMKNELEQDAGDGGGTA